MVNAMIALRIHETGGVDKMRVDEIPVPIPAADEIRFRVEAAGVNFIDTYHRSGLYKMALPITLGQEAAGVVTAVGTAVADFRVGDRVAGVRANGAYAEEATIAAAWAVRVPAAVSSSLAAAVLLQGMTAHYLVNDTFPLRPGQTALIHAGAGGVGLLLTQMAKRRGARIFATVGTEAKAVLARAAGAEAVCIYTKEDFTAAVRAWTGGRGVDVAYDAVGRETFEGTLNSLCPRGMFVSFGNASGPVPPFAPLLLAQKGSLFFTRPTLAHYTQTPEEFKTRVSELFAWMAAGVLQVRVGATYPLKAAAAAHTALEGRATTGKVLLLP